TVHLPAPPICDFPPETDRYAGDAEIEIRQLGQLFAVAVAPLQYNATSPLYLFGDRINLQRIDESRSGFGHRSRHELLGQCCPIFPSWHFFHLLFDPKSICDRIGQLGRVVNATTSKAWQTSYSAETALKLVTLLI